MDPTLEMELFEPIGEPLVINGNSDYNSEFQLYLYGMIILIILSRNLCYK
jgi:hypothetical protein|uniref:Uncharacterized protein n=1 Tax=viral metagenome TaxID=1070528 RepID=A0A6C0DHP4_9ZZZZ